MEPCTTDITGTEDAPLTFEIFSNYPNPFNAQTIIPVLSNHDGVRVIELTVYDILGRMVGEKTIEVKPGLNYIEWGIEDFDGSVGSGVYLYRMGDLARAHRMILLK
jgi:hypothetical protein